jgi:DNA-binding NtrC family response regulator
LWEAVKEHRFREDLYYRIACMTVHLPALRKRRQDIPLLAETLLNRLSRFTRRRYRLTDTALELLQSKDYPGNIRELRNVLFAASARSVDRWIDRQQLLTTFRNTPTPLQNPTPAEDESGSGLPLTGTDQGTRSDNAESHRIATVLKEQYGSRKRTAAALGMSTRTLYRKMKHYGLR